jgi:transposase-like protein
MIKLTYSCKTCNSENIIKNGKNRAGSQTYKCKDCSNYGVLDSVKRTAHIDDGMIKAVLLERNSLRSAGRILEISHVTVWNYLKKAQQLEHFKTSIAPMQTGDRTVLS